MWEAYIEVPVKGDEAALAAIEQQMNVSLPADVRQVILERAGQVTEPEAINVGEARETAFSPILYAGGVKDHQRYTYSIEFVLSTLQGWAEVEELSQLKLLPFASNSASGYFCVDFRETSANPPIVFVDLGYDFEEEGAFKPAAADLASLLEKLH
ncbi:SMI1/KNR4 family protein [Qipengyuania sp. DGS5-3]|uniref:SMI1/KNR4 family protein n=1 Tax=Qipengyuania sp. DGS5-3 TaxID=3349632 RepID=UPI0036D30438